MKRQSIIVATIKSWNIANALKLKRKYSGKYNIHIITHKSSLSLNKLKKINPSFIFFPHWSWIISKEIFSEFECIVFHMTDLPFGRGGSPLQNLISRRINKTKISAIQVDEGLDSGKVYLKRAINISSGSAQGIYRRISDVVFYDMIPEILKNRPLPKPQKGKAVVFKRRKPEQSEMIRETTHSLRDIYDFVRMLDAEGYPRAFIRMNNNLRLELYNVQKSRGGLKGSFEVKNEKTK